MNDKIRDKAQQRQSLINDLTENIIDTTATLIDKGCDQELRDKMAAEISERINFEVNVTLNEMVTKYCPQKIREQVTEAEERRFLRFGVNFRIQHVLMFISVIVLIITGIPLKFPEFAISKFIIIDIFGGLDNSSLIHRIGAVGLIIVGLWHVFYSALSKMGRKDFWLMIPRPRDILDFFHTILYFIGRRGSGPKQGRFSFIEKFDYWAVYWGMVIMIGSGIILWYKEYFPKYIYDIAREAHSDEGLLATLAIVIWHFYNVHFNPEVFPGSTVWLHGQLTESEMKHHHPLEYAEIVEAESDEIQTERQTTDPSEENVK
jgi:cytochrome b subunit of formate dehydrogenase